MIFDFGLYNDLYVQEREAYSEAEATRASKMAEIKAKKEEEQSAVQRFMERKDKPRQVFLIIMCVYI